MATKRANFTDRQKAEIYALDRALCTYSGKSLWLLDFGGGLGSPNWTDHIVPASQGGKAELENGATASWLYNYTKGSTGRPPMLFLRGYPTVDFFTYHEVLGEQVADHLQRFSELHWSDWYFNQAVFCVYVAASQKGMRRNDGKAFVRDANYWAKAAMSNLEKWRNKSVETGSFKQRGLLPPKIAGDHRVLLQLVDAESLTAVKRVISAIAPYHLASWNAMEQLSLIETKAEAREFSKWVRADRHVTMRTKRAIAENLRRLGLR
mgnify:CR=1 FL=1